MRIKELEVFLTDVEVGDFVDDERIGHIIRQAVAYTIERQVNKWAADATRESIQGARETVTERIKAHIGPRLDAVFQSVVDEMDQLDDDQLVEEVFG